jgi:hypothetical protein
MNSSASFMLSGLAALSGDWTAGCRGGPASPRSADDLRLRPGASRLGRSRGLRGLLDLGGRIRRARRGAVVLPGRGRGLIPEYQVAEHIDVDQKQDGQTHQVFPPRYPDGMEEKFGRHEAEKQPQEKAEHGAHGLILPKPAGNGKPGPQASPAGSLPRSRWPSLHFREFASGKD